MQIKFWRPVGHGGETTQEDKTISSLGDTSPPAGFILGFTVVQAQDILTAYPSGVASAVLGGDCREFRPLTVKAGDSS